MNKSYSKNYFEKYAALTLAKMFKINNSLIIQSDRPDLRIPTLNYGIEVTQALTPSEAAADVKKPLYARYSLTPFDHFKRDLDSVKNEICKAIKRKLIKSQKYVSYSYNGLYIFSHCHNLTKNNLKEFLDTLPLDNSFYRFIYINCVTKLYCYDCTSKEILELDYSISELAMMNETSLEFEQNCKKKRRKIDL